MPRIALSVWLLLSALVLGACAEQPQGGVGVVDLDAIGKAVGRDQLIAERVAGLEGQALANGEVSLTGLALRVPAELRVDRGQGAQSADQVRLRLVRDFLIEVERLALAEAKSRGLSVVMLKQPGMLTVTSGSDLTQAVIDRMPGGADSIRK